MEMMLAVPFLFLFALAMMDFAKGYGDGMRAHRAARHVAWAAGRRQEDPASPAPPTAEQLKTLHFRGIGPLPAAESHDETLETDFSSPLPSTEGYFDFGRGLPSFLAGRVEATRASASRGVTTVLMPESGVKSSHLVSFRARREDDPSDPMGWWDPFQWLRDQIVPK